MYKKEQILDWLKAIGAEDSLNEDDSTEWIISGSHRGLTFAVVRVKSEDRIIIQRGVNFADDTMANQLNSDKSTRIQFLHELKQNLMLASARYRLNLDSDDPTITQLMITEAYIYDDGATKHNFFDAYFDVLDASLLCFLAVEKYFTS